MAILHPRKTKIINFRIFKLFLFNEKNYIKNSLMSIDLRCYTPSDMSKPIIDKEVDIPQDVLKDLLTPSEMRMLANRWQIINLLQEGLSIRAIAEKVGVGTDTVVRVSRMMERGNLKHKINETKIKSSKTSWVFGKADE